MSKKISFWKLLRKLKYIKELIEITIELCRYILEKVNDRKLLMMAKRIRDLLVKIFGKGVV